MRADRSPDIRAIRAFGKVATLTVHLRDGSKRDLALSTKSNRWGMLLETLDSMAWDSVEVFDQDGKLLGAHENGAPEDDEDDVTEWPEERIAKVISTVVANTMGECRKMFSDSHNAMAKAMEHLQGAVGAIADTYRDALQLQRATLVAHAGAGAGPDPDAQVMEMIKMGMMLMNKPAPPAAAPTGPRKVG
jgi:hypothetical protein